MKNIMFTIPSDPNITECTITKDIIKNQGATPILTIENKKQNMKKTK